MHASAEDIPPGLRRRLVGLFGLVIAVWATNFGLSLMYYILPPASATARKAVSLSGHPATSIFGLLLLILFFSFALRGRRWAHLALCFVGFASVLSSALAMLVAYGARKQLPGLEVNLLLSTNVMVLTTGVIMLVVLLAKDTRRFFSEGVAPPHWQQQGPRQVDPLVLTAALCQLFLAIFIGAMHMKGSSSHGSLQIGFAAYYRYTSDWVHMLITLAVASGLLLLAALPMERRLRGLLLGVLVTASIFIGMAVPFLFKSIYSLEYFDKYPWRAQYLIRHVRWLAWFALAAALAYKVRHRTSIPALIFLLTGAGMVIILTWVEPTLVGKYWRPPAGYGTRTVLVILWALLSPLVLIPGGWTRWLAGLWLILSWVLLIGTSWMYLRHFLDRVTVSTSAWIVLGSWWAIQRAAETVLAAFVGLRVLEAFDPDPDPDPNQISAS